MSLLARSSRSDSTILSEREGKDEDEDEDKDDDAMTTAARKANS
jgi:hypothetical protein